MGLISKLLPSERLIKFAFVGGSGTLLSLAIFWFFTEIVGIFYIISAAIGIEVSILSNFWLNHVWTFGDRRNDGKRKRGKLVRYNMVSISGMVLNLVILFLLVTFIGINQYISYIIAVFVVFLWNYFFSNKWAWKEAR